ncbi:MAG TPA: SPOR domain-containing protein [Steroidobacteraceae bacterium]|nr:SPOR domain-containing protein [Steroidobacteraceae bacterium]
MKERLTGAIILVALIVLLVPELLTGPIRASATLTATSAAAAAPAARLGPAVPAKAPLHTYTLTLGAQPPAEEAVATPTAEAQPAQSAPERPTQSQAPPTHTQAAPAPQPSRARSSLQAAKSPAHSSLREARSSPPRGGWVVQLGSFAARENADRLARSLRTRGFHVSISPGRAGARVLWRVRAGPVSDRAHAGRLATRLRALGHRGEILPLQ